MKAIDKHIVEANVKLLDENSVLKDDKRILNLRVEEKDKVINDLLSRIATLEYEVERLESIIKQIYEIFKEGRFEDDCDCIQIEELITRELKGGDSNGNN